MLRVCQNCGKTFEGDPAALKCPKCAEISKCSVIRTRTCRQCGRTFPGGPRAWYCPQCREQRKRERDRQRKRMGPARHLGDTDICTICGKPYVIKSGLQKYCPDCAEEAIREIDRRQSKAWNAANTTPEERRNKRHMAAADKVCSICGKTFRPENHYRWKTVTCSPTCAKEYKRRQMEQFVKGHREAINKRQRRQWQEKAAAMTPEELAAHKEKVNARARENYKKRKERQAHAEDHTPQAPDQSGAF